MVTRSVLVAAALAGCAAQPSASVRTGVGEEPVRTGTVSAPSPVPVLRVRRTPIASRSRQANAGPTVETGSHTLNWSALRECENGGSYRSKPGDYYRGAYQFDRTTWASVGGSGDPASALPAEQDYRARLLYKARGRQPWPACGRWL